MCCKDAKSSVVKLLLADQHLSSHVKEMELRESLNLRLECPLQGLGLCKDVQMIHRVEHRVSSGLRKSVGDL